jgi:hypothetical protein
MSEDEENQNPNGQEVQESESFAKGYDVLK